MLLKGTISGNGLGIVFLLGVHYYVDFDDAYSPRLAVQGALRDGPDADPPLNMRRALIFNGAIVATISASVVFIKGRQARKVLDEQKIELQGDR